MARVLLIADRSPPFSGRDFHEGGVGGNTAAVVTLAEGMTELGCDVSVCTKTERAEDVRGVKYCPERDLLGQHFDLALLFRGWSELAKRVVAPRRIYFVTDFPVADVESFTKAQEWSTELGFMSLFQFAELKKELQLEKRPCSVFGLSVCWADYAEWIEGRSRSLLYCSVPNRGLYYLAKLFRAVRRSVPDAELWITSDYSLWGRESARIEYAKLFEGEKGVRYFGAVSRSELVQLQRRARVMSYPCIFPEGFCISAAECMAAGAVPVTTRGFALETTVGSNGVLVKGHPGQWWYDWHFVRSCVRLLRDDGYWRKWAYRGREYASRHYAPDVVARNILEGRGPDVVHVRTSR